jgi:hypothetical protein
MHHVSRDGNVCGAGELIIDVEVDLERVDYKLLLHPYNSSQCPKTPDIWFMVIKDMNMAPLPQWAWVSGCSRYRCKRTDDPWKCRNVWEVELSI